MLTASRMKSGIVIILLASAIVISHSQLTVLAQTATGGIRGVVTDASGAVVPNAKVIAKNAATGIVLQTTTSSEGVYTFPRILPGKYNISLEVAGFKKQEFTDLDVLAGKDTVVDASLEPGAINEVVTVAGGTEALVEKDTVQISSSFQERKIQELPVNVPGSGLDRIAFLVPGVTQGFGNVNANGPTLSVNGNRARSNNFTIDGVDNNDLSIGGPNYFVQNPGVVGEIQVITNNFSAEYGRNQGAIVNYVSKSGTNDFHGSAFWEHLDNANFNSLTNLERRIRTPERCQRDPKSCKPDQNLTNVLGYGVGGPIIKNKIFFFTSGFFRRNPGQVTLRTTSLAPTPAGVQALKAAFPNNPGVQYYADFSAFSLPHGNPTIRPDVAQQTLTIGNITVPMAAPQRTISRLVSLDEYTGRGDAIFGDHRFWGRYFRQKAPGADQLADTNSRGFTGDQPTFSRQVGGGWTYTINPRIVNEFRFNYSLLFVIFGGGGSGGKGNIPHPDEIDTALTNLNPQFNVGGTALLSIGPATNLPQGRTVEAYQFSDNVNLTMGNHQIKTGFDLRTLKNNVPFLPNVNGAYTFGDAARLAANNPNSLVVGLGPATLSYDEFDHFYYFQDDWRIRPNFTLNLGVRYENTGQPINLLNKVTREREQNSATAFWRQTLPLEERVVPRIPADNNNWAPRLGFVYSPRFENGVLGGIFGKDKTVIRGGYGIAYDPAFYNLMLNISTAAPTVFLTSAAGIGVPDPVPTGDKVRGAALASGLIAFNTFDPKFLTRTTVNPDFYSPYSQQWSLGIQRELFRDNVFEARYVGTRGTGLFQTVNLNPRIDRLVNGFSQAYFDPTSNTQRTINIPGFPQLLPSGVRPITCVDNPATRDDESACNGRIYPFGVARERINGAYSTYHGLQLRYDGRLRNQVTVGLTYTWSHAIDNSSEVFAFNGGNSVAVAQNPLDLTRAERGNSGFDARHVFTANFIWDLPFFREQKGIIGRVLGGWQFNGIVLVQPGRPFTPVHQLASRNPYEDAVFMNNFFGSGSHFRPFSGNPEAPLGSVGITDVDACLFFTTRCGETGTVRNLRTSPTGFYSMADLNRGVFTSVTPNDVRFIINGPGAAMRFGTPFGDVARNMFLGDRNERVELSVFKTFRITERFRLQYRLQMFNAFNHMNFGIPNSIILDNAGTTFFNFQENDGSLLDPTYQGRRVITMGLSFIF
jgi:outer membrane receptor protein involved in Fe transport